MIQLTGEYEVGILEIEKKAFLLQMTKNNLHKTGWYAFDESNKDKNATFKLILPECSFVLYEGHLNSFQERSN